MGFDTSFHPVALDPIRDRIIPYLLGGEPLDDLIAQAIHLRKIRARAKDWALAAQRLSPAPRRLLPSLHVWGRPFFIVVDDTEDALDVHDLYLQASLEQADALAAEQLHALAPGLIDPVRALFQPTALPPDDDLRDELLWRLDLLRAAVTAVRQGRTHIEAQGRAHDPRDLLRREVPFAVLTLAAALSPGWMSRGLSWPSHLLDQVPLPTRPFFERPDALLGALPAELPEQPWFLYPTIVENYMVGGLVAPGYPAALRRFLAEHHATLLFAWPEDERAALRIELRKIDEALALAQRRGWALCEATDLYSGLQGALN